MRKAKKILGCIMAVLLTGTVLAGCTPTKGSSSATASSGTKTFSVGMVTDTGGVNDQSFNQSAWEGLQQFKTDNNGVSVKYLESTQSADYSPNLTQFANNNYNLVWGIGYLMADAITTAAKAYPDTKFAIIDDSVDKTPSNLSCVVFKAQESSFLVGYIAALKTKTNHVGFIGGIKGNVIDQFQYGYQAGVDYGASTLGKTIKVDVQYANSFSDAALGKGIAQSMYSKGADIIFAAAGNVGQGLITESKDENKLCIGVDKDQSSLAPNNMLSSAMKNVGKAVQIISKKVEDGENVGGQTFTYGIKDDCVGVPYTDQAKKMCGEDVLNKTKDVQKQIADGKITPPYNKATYDNYFKTLK